MFVSPQLKVALSPLFFSVYGCPQAKKRKRVDRQTPENYPKKSTYLDDMHSSTMEECYETDGTEDMDDREVEELERVVVEEEGEVEEGEELEGYIDYNGHMVHEEDELEREEDDGEEDDGEEDIEVEQEEGEESEEERVEEVDDEEEAVEEVKYDEDEEEEGGHSQRQGEITYCFVIKQHGNVLSHTIFNFTLTTKLQVRISRGLICSIYSNLANFFHINNHVFPAIFLIILELGSALQNLNLRMHFLATQYQKEVNKSKKKEEPRWPVRRLSIKINVEKKSQHQVLLSTYTGQIIKFPFMNAWQHK